MYNNPATIDSYMYDSLATTDSTGSIHLYNSPSITDSYIYMIALLQAIQLVQSIYIIALL